MRWRSSAPASVPLLGAVALFVGWAAAGGAYPQTTWAWGAVVLLALLAVCCVLTPLEVVDLPLTIKLAVGALAGYAAWSFASIAWADDRGAALEGADRTLLYLIVFVLFAAWRQRGASAAVLLGTWTLGVAGVAIATLVALPGAGAAQDLFVGTRLADPVGYPNAAAALWLMPLWPALALASARRVPWALRGLLAGAAVVLLDLALLAQSRGALGATPVVLLLSFAVLPDRVRRLATLVPVAIGVAVTAPAMLHVGDVLGGHGDPARALTHGARAIVIAALATGAVVALGALWDERRRWSEDRERRAHRAAGAVGVGLAAALAIGGLAAAGDPLHRIDSAWSSFKHGYAENKQGNRLVSGLGSNRYDFYRVALDVFGDHPLVGAGADNFQQDYLARGRSTETPRYPHSLELRTLAQTGLVGAALLLAAIGAALVAGLRAARDRDPLARAVVTGALGAFAYWAVHGSADWFWEIAGLGAPAFACLGLACALAPRPPDPPLGARPPLDEPRLALAGTLPALAAVLVLVVPWLGARERERAVAAAATSPARAYADLERARTLDPLSDRADLLAGTIAARLGDLPRADHAFTRALARNPRGSYAALQRGVIASQQGRRVQALALLRRAHALDPRDRVTTLALQAAQAGLRVDVAKVNDALLAGAERLAGG